MAVLSHHENFCFALHNALWKRSLYLIKFIAIIYKWSHLFFTWNSSVFCSRSQKCIFLRFGAKGKGRGERIIASGNGPSGTYHNRSILKKQKRNGTLRSYHGAQYHCPLLHCLVHLCFVYKGKASLRNPQSPSIAIFHIIVASAEFTFQYFSLLHSAFS